MIDNSEFVGRSRLDEFLGAVSQDLVQLAVLHDHELNSGTVGELRTVGFPDNLGLCPGTEKGREAAAMMQVAVSDFSQKGSDALLDALAVDFADIYLSHALRASPYESVWLDEDHLMRQEPMFKVRKWYERYDLCAGDWQQKPDDFIALQLQFVATILDPNFVIDRNENAVRDHLQPLNDAAEFLDEHLLCWLPDFAETVVQRCATPFYAALAALTDIYIDELRDHLAEILGQARPEPQAEAALEPPVDCEMQGYAPGIAPSW